MLFSQLPAKRVTSSHGATAPAFCICSSHENMAVGVRYPWGVSSVLCLTLVRNLVARLAMWDCSAKFAYRNLSWITLCLSSHYICPLESLVTYIIVLNLQSSVTLLGHDWMCLVSQEKLSRARWSFRSETRQARHIRKASVRRPLLVNSHLELG